MWSREKRNTKNSLIHLDGASRSWTDSKLLTVSERTAEALTTFMANMSCCQLLETSGLTQFSVFSDFALSMLLVQEQKEQNQVSPLCVYGTCTDFPHAFGNV